MAFYQLVASDQYNLLLGSQDLWPSNKWCYLSHFGEWHWYLCNKVLWSQMEHMAANLYWIPETFIDKRDFAISPDSYVNSSLQAVLPLWQSSLPAIPVPQYLRNYLCYAGKMPVLVRMRCFYPVRTVESKLQQDWKPPQMSTLGFHY